MKHTPDDTQKYLDSLVARSVARGDFQPINYRQKVADWVMSEADPVRVFERFDDHYRRRIAFRIRSGNRALTFTVLDCEAVQSHLGLWAIVWDRILELDPAASHAGDK